MTAPRCTVVTPIGPLLVETDGAGEALRRIDLVPGPGMLPAPPDTPLLREAAAQLLAYFGGTLTRFDLPLAPEGTPFQQSCWQALRTIPFGETRTYAWEARAVGSPRACRAVGGANHRNPLLLVIPCHRVVATGGGLGGFGAGERVKRYLLAHEGIALPDPEPGP